MMDDSDDDEETPTRIPGLDTLEPMELADGEEMPTETLEEITNPQPRSRWQRRRAAARARREAERKAKSSTGADGTGTAVDISSLLPDLPPRIARGEESSDNGAGDGE